MLRLYRQAFMNEGHASLHDARFPGLTIYWRRKDLMQIEAALAASAAVLEMLAFVSRGKARLFVGAPAAWTDASFEGLRVEGAFLVGAERRDGRVARLTVRAEAGGRLALVNPWPGEARLVRGRRAARVAGPVLAVSLRPGEEATLLPA
jgi:hypothetical protein